MEFTCYCHGDYLPQTWMTCDTSVAPWWILTSWSIDPYTTLMPDTALLHQGGAFSLQTKTKYWKSAKQGVSCHSGVNRMLNVYIGETLGEHAEGRGLTENIWYSVPDLQENRDNGKNQKKRNYRHCQHGDIMKTFCTKRFGAFFLLFGELYMYSGVWYVPFRACHDFVVIRQANARNTMIFAADSIRSMTCLSR